MKKLVNVAIVATLVIFATTAIFIGCKKEGNKVIEQEGVKQQKSENTSPFFNMDYISHIESMSGINIFKLIETPFFVDYFNNLSDVNNYFITNVESNSAYLDTFNYWLDVMVNSLVYEEEVDDIITEKHHNFYIAAEQLSIIYFENPPLDEVIFDGITYHVALGLLNSIGDFRDIFNQKLFEEYPHFYDLPEELQDLVLRVAVIIATYQENCDCQKKYHKTTCEAQLKAALQAAFDKYSEEYNKCRNKGKHSKCVHRAAERYNQACNAAYDAYQQCINDF